MTISPALLVVVMELAGGPVVDAQLMTQTASIADIPPTVVALQKMPAAESSFPAAESLLSQPLGNNTVSSPTAAATTAQPAVIPSYNASAGMLSTEAVPDGPNRLKLIGCMIHPLKRKDATISANVQGKLTNLRAKAINDDGSADAANAVEIREGLQVKAGQILGVQDDRTSLAALEIAVGKRKIAEAEANKKVEVLFAQRGAEAAQTRVDMFNRVNAKTPRAISELEVLEAELESRKAVASLELAKYNLDVVKKTELELQDAEVAAAEVALERQQLIAPFDGTIIEIMRTQGEWLREGDPVMRIVQLDTVELHGHADYRLYSRTMLQNRLVTVNMTDPAGQQHQFAGRVSFIPPIIGTRGLELHIEVLNKQADGHWQLFPGMLIDAVIHLDQIAER